MYLALRDIRFAKGRFVLMGSVVTLISLLLVMLSGLTAGLANQSTSSIDELDADTVAFATSGPDDAEASYTDSRVTSAELQSWEASEHVAAAEPLGITQTQLDHEGTMNVAVFGADPGRSLAPDALSAGGVVISEEIAEDLGIREGDAVQISTVELTVSEIIEDQWYSHSPVVWVSLADWQEVSHLADEEILGTVIAASHVESSSVTDRDQERAEVDAAAGTLSMSPTESFSALASYSSENGSLMMMQGLLYGISALVILAFLSVWTVQRTRDIAVLRALGASQSYVLTDAIAQALVVLLAGALAGGGLGVVGGVLAGQAAPFITDASTTVIPVLGVVILGLAGSVLAVRRVTRVDPMLALGGT